MAGKRRWIVVELSNQGEKELEEIPSILKNLLKPSKTEVFIPVFWSEESLCKEKVHLFDGYVFCKSDCAEDDFFLIEDDLHFRSILTSIQDVARQIEFVSDLKIKSLKKQLSRLVVKNIDEGDFVEILDGTCKSLKGEVLNKEGQVALVSISDLKSTNLLIEVPLASLKKVVKKKSFFDFFKELKKPDL